MANDNPSSFPVEDDARRELLDTIVRTTIQPQTQFVPLDVILSYIAPDAKPAEVEGLSFDPNQIPGTGQHCIRCRHLGWNYRCTWILQSWQRQMVCAVLY